MRAHFRTFISLMPVLAPWIVGCGILVMAALQLINIRFISTRTPVISMLRSLFQTMDVGIHYTSTNTFISSLRLRSLVILQDADQGSQGNLLINLLAH